MRKKSLNQTQRKAKIRRKISLVSKGRHRLTVCRSNNHIYAQLIDDLKGCTVVSASTLEKTLFKSLKGAANKAAAQKVGETIAKRAKDKGVTRVVFDRSGYIYHGRVQALAEAARENGMEF